MDTDLYYSFIVVIGAILWAIWKCSIVEPCLKERLSMSQALNYCKHMATFFQEAMAGNHSLNALNLQSKIGNDLLNLRSNREPNFGF